MSMTVSEPGSAGEQSPRIGFPRHLRAEVSDDRVYLFSERGLTALRGTTTAALAHCLDGSRDVRGLLTQPPEGVSPAEVAATITRLADERMVVLRPPSESAPAETLGYWESAGLDAQAAVAGTSTGRLAVYTVGALDPEPAMAAFDAAGLSVRVDVEPGAADLSVVLCTDYLHPALGEIDAAHRLAGKPWLLAKPTGAVLWLGPVFQPPGPGCWHCLASRLANHRTAESCAQQALGRHGPAPHPAVTVPALASAATHLIALEAGKWLAGYRHPHQRTVWTFDSLDFTGEHHELTSVPQCPNCGDPDLVRQENNRPVTLTSRRKVRDSTGGHRALTPEQMLERYHHLVSPVTGIVTGIRRARGGPEFFNSFRSGPNVAARGFDIDSLSAALRMENGGKGTTPVQAEVSALGEAIERYSGTFQGDEERVVDSLTGLGEIAIHPNRCQLFHPDQYPDRLAWNAAHAGFQRIAPPFPADQPTEWTPVWSLTQQRHRLLPTALLYFATPSNRGLVADSNGNAAGASLEDAVLQGLLELIERDAVALWWYNRGRVPGVDLLAFDDPWVAELRTVYAELHREVWVLDVTSDLGVPTMVAVSSRMDRGRADILFGFGAHLDPRIAVRRALTELNQLMPALIAADADGAEPCDDPDALRWFRTATKENQPYLRPDPRQGRKTPRDYSYRPAGDIRAEIDMIRARIEKRGMEMLVLDQTRPDIGLPVVKVIVPGLRHFWARFAPGRLYDVPVALGRQPEPTPYHELNPIPMFL
jgi:bacteriocin biosynthesis cyclodehydratase domain-containing protein